MIYLGPLGEKQYNKRKMGRNVLFLRIFEGKQLPKSQKKADTSATRTVVSHSFAILSLA